MADFFSNVRNSLIILVLYVFLVICIVQIGVHHGKKDKVIATNPIPLVEFCLPFYYKNGTAVGAEIAPRYSYVTRNSIHVPKFAACSPTKGRQPPKTPKIMQQMHDKIARLEQTFLATNQSDSEFKFDLFDEFSFEVDSQSWQTDVPATCEDVYVLSVVLSAADNFNRRQVIRKTWANPDYFNETKIRAIFVLGVPESQFIQDVIDVESAIYGDILQIPVKDEYRRLVCKTVAGLYWASNHCCNKTWVAKIDDDVVVNPFVFRNYLLQERQPLKVIYGEYRKANKPFRTGKWALTREEYRPSRLPKFVLGPTYFMRKETLIFLLNEVPNVEAVYLEDVYFTGLVARQAKVKHKSTSKTIHYRGKLIEEFMKENKHAFWVKYMTEEDREVVNRKIFAHKNKE